HGLYRLDPGGGGSPVWLLLVWGPQRRLRRAPRRCRGVGLQKRDTPHAGRKDRSQHEARTTKATASGERHPRREILGDASGREAGHPQRGGHGLLLYAARRDGTSRKNSPLEEVHRRLATTKSSLSSAAQLAVANPGKASGARSAARFSAAAQLN